MEEKEERRSSCEGRERDGGRTHYCGGLGCGGLTDPRPRGCRLNEGRVNGSLPPLGVATVAAVSHSRVGAQKISVEHKT